MIDFVRQQFINLSCQKVISKERISNESDLKSITGNDTKEYEQIREQLGSDTLLRPRSLATTHTNEIVHMHKRQLHTVLFLLDR